MCRPPEDPALEFHRPRRWEPHTYWEHGGRMKATHKSIILWHVLALAYQLSSSFCQCNPEPTPLPVNGKQNRTGQHYRFTAELICLATHPHTHLEDTPISNPAHFTEKPPAKRAVRRTSRPLPDPAHWSQKEKFQWFDKNRDIQNSLIPSMESHRLTLEGTTEYEQSGPYRILEQVLRAFCANLAYVSAAVVCVILMCNF